MNLSRILDEARASYKTAGGKDDVAGNEATLKIVENAWPDVVLPVPTWEAAELCRLAMASLARLERYDWANVWRQRCVRISFECGYSAGLAKVIMAEMLRTRAMQGDPAAAAAVLDEMKPLITRPGVDPQTRDELLGLFFEKSGFLLYDANLFKEGERIYDEALANAARTGAEQDRERRMLKIRAGKARCTFRIDPDGEPGVRGLRETEEVLRLAQGFAPPLDIAPIAKHNVDAMKTRALDDLWPYEVL